MLQWTRLSARTTILRTPARDSLVGISTNLQTPTSCLTTNANTSRRPASFSTQTRNDYTRRSKPTTSLPKVTHGVYKNWYYHPRKRRKAQDTSMSRPRSPLASDKKPHERYTIGRSGRVVDMDSVAMYHRLSQDRRNMINLLALRIKDRFGKQYTVVPFGSTCYGGATGGRASDVDLSILDAEHPYGFEPGFDRFPPIYNVNHLAGFLASQGYSITACISTAAVPIVKLHDPLTDLSFDLNVNHRLGVYNTGLLRQYCLRLPPLAPLIRRIKTWAKYTELNSPNGALGKPPSFSSYSLTLMTIAVLQHRRLLPNLQGDEEYLLDTHCWELGKDGTHKKIDVRYGACKTWRQPPKYDPLNELCNWFKYWGSNHDYTNDDMVVSIRDGGLVPKEAATMMPPPLPPGRDGSPSNFGRLVVLDPFIEKNCTQRISIETLMYFRRKCKEQFVKLSSAKRMENIIAEWPTL